MKTGYFIFLILIPVLSIIPRPAGDIIREEYPTGKEEMIMLILREDSKISSDQENRKLASSILRFARQINFPDKTEIASAKVDSVLFLLSLIKLQSGYEKYNRKNSMGYAGITEPAIQFAETTFKTSIDRDQEIYEPDLNLKIATIYLSSLLETTGNLKESVLKFRTENNGKSNGEFYSMLENSYATLKKRISTK